MALGLLDLIVFVVFVVSVISLGMLKSRDEKSGEDYFLAGRGLKWWQQHLYHYPGRSGIYLSGYSGGLYFRVADSQSPADGRCHWLTDEYCCLWDVKGDGA